MSQKILITGTAGFIGFHLVEALLKLGNKIVGIDNINDYYDVGLKYDRLHESGIEKSEIQWYAPVQSKKHLDYRFIRMNLEDKKELMELAETEGFDLIINLAGQAGVRYSIENPDAYGQSNLIGFLNILEVARHYPVKHLIYASSSSVYGMNEKMPFSVEDNVDHPISLYAATKKANELMAHAYSHLYNIPTTGLRFFTVYGPWGRPDMAYFLFAEAINKGEPIKVFNNGKLRRDFTYIDDIIDGVVNIIDNLTTLLENRSEVDSNSNDLYRIFNIGNNKTVELMEFIEIIGESMGKKPEMIMMDMQPGDVVATWANIDPLIEEFNYKPHTSIKIGIPQFITWFKQYSLLPLAIENK